MRNKKRANPKAVPMAKQRIMIKLDDDPLGTWKIVQVLGKGTKQQQKKDLT